MADPIGTYMHKHTRVVVAIIVVVFGLLGAGEYYLYLNQVKLSKMMSEGLMQIKEELKKGTDIIPTITVTKAPDKIK